MYWLTVMNNWTMLHTVSSVFFGVTSESGSIFINCMQCIISTTVSTWFLSPYSRRLVAPLVSLFIQLSDYTYFLPYSTKIILVTCPIFSLFHQLEYNLHNCIVPCVQFFFVSFYKFVSPPPLPPPSQYHSNCCQHWSSRDPSGWPGYHGDRIDIGGTTHRGHNTDHCRRLVLVSSH